MNNDEYLLALNAACCDFESPADRVKAFEDLVRAPGPVSAAAFRAALEAKADHCRRLMLAAPTLPKRPLPYVPPVRADHLVLRNALEGAQTPEQREDAVLWATDAATPKALLGVAGATRCIPEELAGYLLAICHAAAEAPVRKVLLWQLAPAPAAEARLEVPDRATVTDTAHAFVLAARDQLARLEPYYAPRPHGPDWTDHFAQRVVRGEFKVGLEELLRAGEAGDDQAQLVHDRIVMELARAGGPLYAPRFGKGFSSGGPP